MGYRFYATSVKPECLSHVDGWFNVMSKVTNALYNEEDPMTWWGFMSNKVDTSEVLDYLMANKLALAEQVGLDQTDQTEHVAACESVEGCIDWFTQARDAGAVVQVF